MENGPWKMINQLIQVFPDDKAVLAMLNKYFRTTTFEKHPKAMLTIIFDQAMDKILGKDYAKQRISKRKQLKLYEAIIHRLRNCYGKYINLTNFKCKDPNEIKFLTNFDMVYKTEFGLLYAYTKEGIWSTIFFTEHCLERFDERCRQDIREVLDWKVCKFIKAQPTAADVIMTLTTVGKGDYEYGFNEPYYYLNIGPGFLVLEDYQDFFVAKTFLSPKMVDSKTFWYQPDLDMDQLDYPSKYFRSLKELLIYKPKSIKMPLFLDDIIDIHQLGYVKQIDESEPAID
jgi:hypothetical protein